MMLKEKLKATNKQRSFLQKCNYTWFNEWMDGWMIDDEWMDGCCNLRLKWLDTINSVWNCCWCLGCLTEIIPRWKSRLRQLIITLHRTSDQGREEPYKSHHHIRSPSSLPPLHTLKTEPFAEMQIIMSLSSSFRLPQPPTQQISHAHLLKWRAVTRAAYHTTYCLSSVAVGIGLTSQIRCGG